MEIVKLTLKDWEKYKNLRLDALKNESAAFGTSYEEALKKTDEEWKEDLKKPENFLFSARINDKLVGMAAAYLEKGEKCNHVAYVWGVYVHNSFRGQGIGKKLMEVLLGELKRKRIVKANLNVTTVQVNAYKLYQSLGFQTVGVSHKELYIDGKFYDEYSMEIIFQCE